MKVTDLRRKLLAALAAAGLLTPSAAYAANLNENLVVNGDFESVDLAVTSDYNAPRILTWVGAPAFAYTHDGSSSNAGVGSGFADGTPPPPVSPAVDNHWYFTSNRKTTAVNPYITTPGQFYQDIDVSTGASSDAIATGLAAFQLSGYMSSYLNDTDVGHIHLNFRNGSGTSIGNSVLNDNDPAVNNVWDSNTLTAGVIDPLTATGVIPAGTATVRVSLYGTRTSGGPGPDGYIDNVGFQVTSLPVLVIQVNRANGNITLKNVTGGSVPISGYSITSAFEAMSTTNWLSITDHYDAGNAGPNQVDAAHAWSELTSPTAHTDLSEADLQSGLGGAVPVNATINLGDGDWIQNPHEDLVFEYVSNGQIKSGIVTYTGNNNHAFASGDLNVDGIISSADWVILRGNQLANLSALSPAQAYRLGDLTGDKNNDFADFIQFKSVYDAAYGAGAFALMVAAVPEPSTTLLLLAAGTMFLPSLRRRSAS